MRIVVQAAGGDREVDVALRNPEATLGELLHAVLGNEVPATVAIDERVVPAWWRVVDSGLHEGATLAPVPEERRAEAHAPLELVILSGLDSGRAFPLPVGRSTLGRDAGNTIMLADASVSRRHCALEVDADGCGTVTDLGSANGTLVDGTTDTTIAPDNVIGLGALNVAIRVPTDDDRPHGLDLRRHLGAGGTLAFNRPPRLEAATEPPALELPTEPSEAPKPQFSIASTLGPLVLAGVMVSVSGDPRFALFALLSPFIAIGSYFESRRRGSRKNAKDQRQYESDLDQLERRIGEAARRSSARSAASAPPTPRRCCAARPCPACACGSGGPSTTTSCTCSRAWGTSTSRRRSTTAPTARRRR